MKTSCLRLKLVGLNFLVSFNTDDQSKTDVANTANVITYLISLISKLVIVLPLTDDKFKHENPNYIKFYAPARNCILKVNFSLQYTEFCK